MPRFIDADALIPDLLSRRREIPHHIDSNTDWYLQGFNVGIVHAVVAVENAPTISPDEVRGEGKWEEGGYFDEMYGRSCICSACGSSALGFPNYCPNCGAKMVLSVKDLLEKAHEEFIKEASKNRAVEYEQEVKNFRDCRCDVIIDAMNAPVIVPSNKEESK